jgi:hypothetical protein
MGSYPNAVTSRSAGEFEHRSQSRKACLTLVLLRTDARSQRWSRPRIARQSRRRWRIAAATGGPIDHRHSLAWDETDGETEETENVVSGKQLRETGRPNKPSSCQRLKEPYVLLRGGRSFGISRHAIPPRRTQKTAFRVSRRVQTAPRLGGPTRGRGANLGWG